MHHKNSFILLLFIIILVCSCGTRKHRYLQAKKNVSHDTIYQQVIKEYRLQSNDVLYIRVQTDKEEYATLFNATSSQQQQTSIGGSYLYFSGYPIDIEGNIEMPLIGKIQAAGHTVAQVEQLVHQKISEIVYNVQVTVRLGGFRINIVGEVKSPGEYVVYRDRATIMEALSLAGDMSYYGNRKEIMVYRTTKEGVVMHPIDLTDRNALSSPVFYLQPNDMVYVEPLPRTIFRVNVSDVVTYISAISSSLALVVAIVSLTK